MRNCLVRSALALSEPLRREQQRFAIAPMLQLPPEELTRLLLTLSREKLLERFGGQLAEEVSGGNLKNLL